MKGIAVTLFAWALLWGSGEATARLLFGRRYMRVASAARLPLGLACTTCLLEGAGYFMPIRVAAWLALLPAAYGLVAIGTRLRKSRTIGEPGVASVSLLALVLGLAPVAMAGRFTASALTNNDGTYYITVADRLLQLPWATTFPYSQSSQCLNEIVLHFWNWRTGTPNLMAAVSALFGMTSQAALAVVTAVLLACVPPVAITIARGVGIQRGGLRDAVVGVLAACSSAPAFVGYQHMTGHLAACSLFPLTAAAVLGAVRNGGVRRYIYAAVFLGSGVAFFADGAPTLLIVLAASIASGYRRLFLTALRTSAVIIGSVAVAPFTLTRALHAAVDTVRYFREGVPQGAPLRLDNLFPQRGWLPRSPLDNLATLTGVDPWPPWPAAWPPNAETFLAWTAASCGAALFVVGVARLWPRRPERIATLVLIAAVLLSVWRVDIHYLKGKMLLTGAAFATPIIAIGAAALLARSRARLLVLFFGMGELFALGHLFQPSLWKVIDRPAHDALVTELARLPANSLIALDGLGAPADAVLDAHRARRAALLAELLPIQPGLDGGFYTPRRCPTASRPEPLPSRAFALQRSSSETLTRGKELASWDGFRLLEVNLDEPDAFVAAWAPTHGWLRAEQEPGGGVFRWAELQAKGTLQVMARARCARLRGELRVVDGTAAVGIKIGEDPVYTGGVNAAWSAFVTRRFNTVSNVTVEFQVLHAAVPAPDIAHALAVRGLVLEPTRRCGAVSTGTTNAPAEFPMDFGEDLQLSIELPAAACSKVSLTIAGDSGGSVRVSVDGGPPVLHYMATPIREAIVDFSGSASLHRLNISHSRSSSSQRWQLMDVEVMPDACPR